MARPKKPKKREAKSKVISDDFNPWSVMEPRLLTLDTLQETDGVYTGLINNVTYQETFNKLAGFPTEKIYVYLEKVVNGEGSGQVQFFYIPNKKALEVLAGELSPDDQSVQEWKGAIIDVSMEPQQWGDNVSPDKFQKVVRVLSLPDGSAPDTY